VSNLLERAMLRHQQSSRPESASKLDRARESVLQKCAILNRRTMAASPSTAAEKWP
jgi:hypothetical protein